MLEDMCLNLFYLVICIIKICFTKYGQNCSTYYLASNGDHTCSFKYYDAVSMNIFYQNVCLFNNLLDLKVHIQNDIFNERLFLVI